MIQHGEDVNTNRLIRVNSLLQSTLSCLLCTPHSAHFFDEISNLIDCLMEWICFC